MNPGQRSYSAYNHELLSIKRFQYSLEGRPFALFTDQKPDKVSPSQLQYLAVIGRFTLYMQYVSGKDNWLTGALPRTSEIDIPVVVDFSAVIAAQKDDAVLQRLRSGSKYKFKDLRLTFVHLLRDLVA